MLLKINDLSLKQDLVFEEALDQSSENYRIVKDKYDNGLSNTNDLLEADVDQLISKINNALDKANTFQKYYELLSATGQLTPTFNLSKTNQAPSYGKEKNKYKVPNYYTSGIGSIRQDLRYL